MAALSKTQFLVEMHHVLKERYPMESGPAPKFSVLEAVILGICREGTTRDQANQALSRFKVDFFDMNEVRVSTLQEIQERLAGIPEAALKAERIRKFLRQLFRYVVKNNEKTKLEYVLDVLIKKPLKEALKTLEIFEVMKLDYVSASVIQLALGGHAIPIDYETRRAFERLGFIDQSMDHSSLRGLVERAISKNRGVEFITLVEELTHETREKFNEEEANAVYQDIVAKIQVRAAITAAAQEAKAKADPSSVIPEESEAAESQFSSQSQSITQLTPSTTPKPGGNGKHHSSRPAKSADKKTRTSSSGPDSEMPRVAADEPTTTQFQLIVESGSMSVTASTFGSELTLNLPSSADSSLIIVPIPSPNQETTTDDHFGAHLSSSLHDDDAESVDSASNPSAHKRPRPPRPK